jgi:hypothetical protein
MTLIPGNAKVIVRQEVDMLTPRQLPLTWGLRFERLRSVLVIVNWIGSRSGIENPSSPLDVDDPTPRGRPGVPSEIRNLLNLLNQITGAPAGQRQTVLLRQFTGEALNLNDEIWREDSGGGPDEHAPPMLNGVGEKTPPPQKDHLTAGVPTCRDFRR